MAEDEITPPKKVSAWHRRNSDVPLVVNDWGPRSETGESAGRTQASELVIDPQETWWWERQRPLWKHRSQEDVEVMVALEEFFTPYLDRMKYEHAEALRRLFNDRLTYREQAGIRQVSRQAQHKLVRRAVKQLMREVAMDCPRPTSAWLTEERALCTLDAYWQERFGYSFPGIIRGE
jgi:hypothetical protein